MFTDWLRKISKGIVDPIAGALASIGVTANLLTIIGCLLNVGVSAIIATGRLRLGGILLIATALTDAFDGAVARKTGSPTKFGAYLDSTLDRVSDAAVLGALAWHYGFLCRPQYAMLAFVSVVGFILVSYTRARAEGLGIECKVGLFTRVERMVVLVAGLVLGLTPYALWLLAVGTWFTVGQRVWHVYRASQGQSLEG